ncbi:MAG: metalloregulator ArsR/SmtB family transcription factor [Gammaproteobacteria bacterium]|nr:metalloregulator ArsR/SmtB family transcription factor [Gammaproteobacteria bacterium]
MTQRLPDLLRALRAIAEPTRLRLLAVCRAGELTVGEITRIIGQSQPRVSRHLKLLCDAGLLERFREGHWVFYRVPTRGHEAELARAVLELLSPDDETARLDRQRMNEVMDERARLASDYLDTLHEAPQAVPDAQVDDAIVRAFGDAPLGNLLDIGTGSGRILRLLASQAEQATGVDISSEMLMVARTNLHAAGLHHCTVRHGNMYKLPFGNASFDTVTVDQVLSQAEEPALVLTEAARILRPGGSLLVVDVAAGADGVEADDMAGWLEAVGLGCAHIEHVQLPRTRSATLLLAHKASSVGDVAA